MFEVKSGKLAVVDELRLPLINRFYNECHYDVKCGKNDRVYSFTVNGKIIAAARLMLQKSNVYLLRNLCVSPELRNQGIATYFLKNILHDLTIQSCYCYALPHLKNFYLAVGFKELAVDQVPNDIAEMHLRNQLRKRGWLLMGFVHSEPAKSS